MDDQSNPYASPTSVPDTPERRRPLGALLWAVVLWLCGIVFGGGVSIGFAAEWIDKGPPQTLDLIVWALFVLLGCSAVAAAFGLMSGRGWGWWAGVWTAYQMVAMFVLVPTIRIGINHLAWFKALVSVVVVVFWIFLHKQNVLTFYSQMGRRRWPLHCGLLLLAAAVALGIGMR